MLPLKSLLVLLESILVLVLAGLFVEFVQILNGKLPQLLLDELGEVSLFGLFKQLHSLDVHELLVLLECLPPPLLLFFDRVHPYNNLNSIITWAGCCNRDFN